MTNIGGRDWIIKFPAHADGKEIGKMEYDYSITARKCGIEMAKTKLFPSDMCEGYFGTERFDRYVENGIIKRRHMVTVSGILEVSHEMPSLDYNDLMKLTNILTHYDKSQIEQMYRRMCFNIFAHNRDDHSSNFSFVYDKIDGWRLSPAYDLTYSTTYYGEHTTTVDGNGIRPERKDLVSVGMKAGLSRSVCDEIADEIEQIVMEELNIYLS